MTTATQPDVWDMLAAIAAEPGLPSRHTDREHIEAAVTACAAAHGGLVHISDVRPFITRDVTPHLIGSVISALHSTGHLVSTGEYRPNGGPSGNANKPARVSRLVRPID